MRVRVVSGPSKSMYLCSSINLIMWVVGSRTG